MPNGKLIIKSFGNMDICSELLFNIIHFGITNATFDEGMKLADITPIFKKDESFSKENYRPVSCLPAGSKVFERILHKQNLRIY